MNETEFDRALALVSRVAERDNARAAPACRSLFLSHGRRTRRCTLFLHGMTASPRQFAALAEYAFRSGDNVFVPRLPRHGHPNRLTGVLRDLRAAELLASAERSLAIARGLGEGVRVVGFSLGGLLGAWIAHHHDVEEAIAIAPFLGIAGVPRGLTASSAMLLRRMPNIFLWWDPIRRAGLMPAHGYPRFPTHAIAEMLTIAVDLLAAARTQGPRSPVTLVTNAGELGVNNAAVGALAKAWRAQGTVPITWRRLTGLGPSHDIIEPLRERAKVWKSYPLLLPLLDEVRR